MYDKKNPPKFPMHDLHLEKSIRHVRNACLLSATVGFLFYVFHSVPHKNAYTNFYANYNANDSFKRMRAAGVFSSCPAEGEGEKKEDDKAKQ